MSPITNHIKSAFGIDLDLDRRTRVHPTAWLRLPKDASLDTPHGRGVIEHYLEHIYDCVVGSTAAHGFGSRIDVASLKKLKATAEDLKLNLVGQSERLVLDEIVKASTIYIRFLSGAIDTPAIPKEGDVPGCRHTLVRTDGGRFYEMMNSMSEVEANRFRRKTRMISPSVENAKTILKAGKEYKKIELGEGSFGKARIARDIDRDQYMAVKKLHPKLDWNDEECRIEIDEPVPSIINTFLDVQKEALTKIRHSIVLPDDECEYSSGQAKKLESEIAQFKDGIVNRQPLPVIRFLIENGIVDPHDRLHIVSVLQAIASAPRSTEQISLNSIYQFSELGIAPISFLAESFNILRVYFEMPRPPVEVKLQALELLKRYSEKVNRPGGNLTPEQVSAYHLEQATLKLQRSDFKLTDQIYNQRFLNTLGKKMVATLAQLHAKGFGHCDVKPANIVLCQGTNGVVSVKLIDIDLLKPIMTERTHPIGGTPAYLPPEVLKTMPDGSIPFKEDIADSFAMGVSLREILGFTGLEISALRGFLKLDKAGRKRYARSAGGSFLQNGNRPQNHTRIAAKMHVAPEMIALKDISDMMLKADVGKRRTAREVLAMDFFRRDENFLSDQEFSSHALFIVALGALIPADHKSVVNDDSPDAVRLMAAMRISSQLKYNAHTEANIMSSGKFASVEALQQAIDRRERYLKTVEKMRYDFVEKPRLLAEFQQRGGGTQAAWAFIDKRPGLLK